MRRTSIYLLVATSVVACASRDSPMIGEAPLAIARVERIEPTRSVGVQAAIADALGPLGLAVRALRPASPPAADLVLLTRTGERVELALANVGTAAYKSGDCVAIVPLDPNAGLRARYGRGEARLAPSRGCDQLGK
jgi:hypothetical protein